MNNYNSNNVGGNNNGNRQRKNVISCVSVGDSDNEDRHCTPKQNASDSSKNRFIYSGNALIH